MINVPRRNFDGFEELGYETETVSSGFHELGVLSNLIHRVSATDEKTENTRTNLLQPVHQLF